MNPGNSAVWIRPYERRDRHAVRTICCDTADGGKPVERFFPDREIFADLLTAYYTDFEPESSWVGGHEDEIVGYVTGCLVTRRFIRVMAFRIMPCIIWKTVRHHALRDPQARSFVRDNIRLWLRSGSKGTVNFTVYPSHLHVNLKPGFRSQGLGRGLVTRFLEQAKAGGSCGVHVNVREDSDRTRNFFEKLGFVPTARHPVMQNLNVPGGIIYSVTYCVSLR